MDPIVLAALGRPFSLGMLYDCRRDLLIPGFTLWDYEALEKDTRTRPQPNTEFDIVTSETIEDKTSSLNVNASLKASFLGGMVNVNGSAKYLTNSKTSQNQARVTLKYKATTEFQELSMQTLGPGSSRHAHVFDSGIQATHVVTGILKGAQAFFVFDRNVSHEENRQDIEGNLKVIIKKIPSLAVDGQGSLQMKDTDIEKIEKLTCKFYGDFSLKKNPVSFKEGIEVYQSLPELLGPKGENAVPVEVWLTPLQVLDSTAAQLVRQISIGLVNDAQRVLEDLNELELRYNDAIQSPVAQHFPQISKKLTAFKELCNEYTLEFQRILAKKLPSIRGGGEEESVLAEILKRIHSSPFNYKDLSEWMRCKEREINIIRSLTDMMKNTKIVSSHDEVDQISLSPETEHVVCFAFTSMQMAEPYLSTLSTYLRETSKQVNTQDTALHTHDVEKEQWYFSKDVYQSLIKKANLLIDFSEANKENKNIRFLTTSIPNESQKGASIYLYKDGFEVNDNFEPPSKPEKTAAIDITHNSVTLKMHPPGFGAEDISHYSIEYCVTGQDDWQQQTASKADEVTVSNLTPNTEYKFRYRAVCPVGRGPASEVSGSMKTLPKSPPGKPSVPLEKSLTLTKEVLQERQTLEITVENLQKRVELGLAKIEEIRKTTKILEKHEADIVANENFEYEVSFKKPVQVKKDGYNTNCQNCYTTCHYPCRTANDKDKFRCAAMGSDGNCKSCPKKCHWTSHFNQKYNWETKMVTEVRTYKDLQEKYQHAKKDKMSVQDQISKLTAEYDDLQDQVVKLMEMSSKCLDRLKVIALKPNPLSTPEYIDLLIEEELSQCKPGYMDRIKSLKEMRVKAEYMAKVEKGKDLL